MTRFDPDADPETRRAQAQFEMQRSGPLDSGCASGALAGAGMLMFLLLTR